MALDEDGDLSVSEYEFLRFMLSSADLVDAEALDSLHKRFQVWVGVGGSTRGRGKGGRSMHSCLCMTHHLFFSAVFSLWGAILTSPIAVFSLP